MHELAPYSLRVTFPTAREDSALLIEPLIQEQDSGHLWDYWWVISSRLRLILVFFCGTVLATGVVLLCLPVMYTAEVTILIERRPPRVLDIHEASGESLLPDDYDFYKTQYELLKSRTLASQVIRELDLHPGIFHTSDGRGFWHGIATYRQ